MAESLAARRALLASTPASSPAGSLWGAAPSGALVGINRQVWSKDSPITGKLRGFSGFSQGLAQSSPVLNRPPAKRGVAQPLPPGPRPPLPAGELGPQPHAWPHRASCHPDPASGPELSGLQPRPLFCSQPSPGPTAWPAASVNPSRRSSEQTCPEKQLTGASHEEPGPVLCGAWRSETVRLCCAATSSPARP